MKDMCKFILHGDGTPLHITVTTPGSVNRCVLIRSRNYRNAHPKKKDRIRRKALQLTQAQFCRKSFIEKLENLYKTQDFWIV
jgi:hypothetical protein